MNIFRKIWEAGDRPATTCDVVMMTVFTIVGAMWAMLIGLWTLG